MSSKNARLPVAKQLEGGNLLQGRGLGAVNTYVESGLVGRDNGVIHEITVAERAICIKRRKEKRHFSKQANGLGHHGYLGTAE